jgi:hypothetical protein
MSTWRNLGQRPEAKDWLGFLSVLLRNVVVHRRYLPLQFSCLCLEGFRVLSQLWLRLLATHRTRGEAVRSGIHSARHHHATRRTEKAYSLW